MSESPAETPPDADIERLGRRAVLAILGLVLVAAGIALAAAGGGPPATSSGLELVGLLALVVGFVLAVVRLGGGGDVRRAPPVERRKGVELVGTGFEETVRRATEADAKVRSAVQSGVRDRIWRIARDTLAETYGGPEGAVTALADGSWTDDDVAGAFLGTNHELRRRITMPAFDERVRRAVDALAEATLDGPRSERGKDTPERDWLEEPWDEHSWQSGSFVTGHWRGIGALVLFALAAAALWQTPGLVLVAATLLGVVGYVRVTRIPPVVLDVERAFATENPRPGDTVEVTVTVTNESGRLLPDLRLVDVVPSRLAVVDGPARYATSLPPDESATFSYEVLAVYGEHAFEAVHLAARDASGHRERTETYATDTHTLACKPGVVRESVPLHPQDTGVTGRVPSNTGGSGQELQSVREYRRGDPLRRVDWNRLARTGDLSTVELREEYAANVVLLVDALEQAFRSPTWESLSALDRSLAGASQLFTTLSDDGDRVGLASIAADWLWIEPGAGSAHRSRVRAALTGEDIEPEGDERNFQPEAYIHELRTRIPADTQLLVLSPLLDPDVLTVVRRLHAHGHDVTVFSPDPTRLDSVGATVAHLERQLALRELRRSDIRVVDWPPGESFARAAHLANRRWKS